MPNPSRLRRPLLAAALATVAFAACNDHRDRKSAMSTQAEGKADDGNYYAADKSAAMDEVARPADMPPSGGASGGGFAQMPIHDARKVIRTGNVDLVVKTYEDARAKLDALVTGAGGFVDATQVSHSEGQVSRAYITIRVPASTFGELLPKLRELGEIQSENTDASDITAEYTDLAARLDNARALERRLIELAANRTGTVSDVLEVERELARVRGEIEQYEGRIRMWDDQVSLSTLTITMSTEQPEIVAKPVAAPTFRHKVGGAFDDSVGAMKDAGEALAMAGVSLLPWLPLIIPGLLLGRRAIRRYMTSIPKAIAVSPYYPPPPPPPPPAIETPDPA